MHYTHNMMMIRARAELAGERTRLIMWLAGSALLLEEVASGPLTVVWLLLTEYLSEYSADSVCVPVVAYLTPPSCAWTINTHP